jgi:23S rRNA pseudouridine2605 synthase
MSKKPTTGGRQRQDGTARRTRSTKPDGPVTRSSASAPSRTKKSDGDDRKKPVRKTSATEEKRPATKRPGAKPDFKDGKRDFKGGKPFGKTFGKPYDKKKKPIKKSTTPPDENTEIRLNRFIANSGICSRRDADVMITTGVVSVNGIIVTELGTKVTTKDVVKYDGHTIRPEKKQYILLNKPKNFLATFEDPRGRNTVMQLIKGASKEVIFPVGKMDRSAMGLLLFTNDEDMAKRLLSPSSNVKNIFHVTTREKMKPSHIDEIRAGVTLDDGLVKIDQISFVGDGQNFHEVGIELRSGRPNIVKRIFDHFGYNITKLDRVVLAGLTKKDLPRGHWRHLTQEEISFLYMNS